jgi:hypothetical protein
MANAFLFLFVAFFSGIPGLILGGIFRVLIFENEAIESPILRLIFFLIFFSPAYVPIAGFSYVLLTGNEDGLGPIGYGILTGLLVGGITSFKIAGKQES